MSVSTAAYDGYDFHEIFPSLARCGVEQVEVAFIEGYVAAFSDDDLTTAYGRELREEMRRNGQECRYFSGHIDLGEPDACQRLEARCRFASSLGASFVITNAASMASSEAFLAQADELAAIARHYGMRILLENPGNRIANLIDHSGHLAPILEKLATPEFGINFDVGNLLSHCPEFDPLADALAAVPCVDHFHIKPCHRGDDGIVFTYLGEGDIDEAPLLRRLLKDGIPFSLELPFRLRRDRDAQPWRLDSAVPLKEIEENIIHSIQWVNNIQSEI
ncbi:sugar phosphate isomerase/epimerase family protein [Halomonas sp. M4R1S46]|uniref:sugar phosphate isomerase/epimerase family protein n=1 Tax=Halomonas sp. M4R1S46 TaxID=2982692 RepID=UPI0021E4086F|nr:sugar phosphate isomerase/epimerase [Halomonas sp. M4R1S46]UYG09015.1 sugar phosphate isomerase/epimerase [Halomonas sp. M4R1S46]